MNDGDMMGRKRLYFVKIPGQDSRIAPLIEELSPISALRNIDLQRVLVGNGLHEFPATDSATRNEVHSVLLKHQLAAMVVDEEKPSVCKVVNARYVELAGSEVILLDRGKNEILKIDKQTDLHIILADADGRYQNRFLRSGDSSGSDREFEDVLDEIARFTPLADIYVSGNGDCAVRVDSRDFAFAGLKDRMGVSRGFCFANLMKEMKSAGRSVRYDDRLGSSTGAGTVNPVSGRGYNPSFLDIYGTLMVGTPQAVFGRRKESPATEPLESVKNERSKKVKFDPRRPPPPPSVEKSSFCPGFPETMSLFPIIFLILFPLIIEVARSWLSFSSEVLTFVINAGGVLSVLYGLHLLGIRGTILKTPLSRIRSASMGRVGIAGKAMGRYDLLAPFLMMPCVYYDCRIYVRDYRMSSSGGVVFETSSWKLSRRYTSGRVPFYVADESGRVCVEPENAFLCGLKKYRQVLTGDHPGLLGIGGIGSDTKVVLDLIPEGERVYVLGFAARKWQKKTVRERIRERLDSIKYSKTAMARYDLNGDKCIDDYEREAAAREMEEELRFGYRSKKRIRPELEVVVGKAPFGRIPFVISSSRRSLVRRLAVDGFLLVGSGLALIVLSNLIIGYLF